MHEDQDSSSKTPPQTAKDKARAMRNAADARAKAAMKASPQFAARQEAARRKRRDLYEKAKAAKKQREKERQLAAKAATAADREEQSRERAESLQKLVKRGSDLEAPAPTTKRPPLRLVKDDE
jgi:hypothetical protein